MKTEIESIISTALANFVKAHGAGSAPEGNKTSKDTPTGSSSPAPLPQAAAALITPAKAPTPQPIIVTATTTTTTAPKEDLTNYIAAMSPFTHGLDDPLKVIHRLVQGYTVIDGASFPNSSNMGLSKDKK